MLSKITIVVLTVALVDVALANRRAVKSIKMLGDVCEYLGTMLYKNGVELDEFDKLAIRSLADK